MADFDEINAFVAVVRCGGFSAGAKELGLTRSAVGKAIARLEENLGTRLLNRTTRSVGTTIDGERFYGRCVQILADLKEAKDIARDATPEPRGVLRIALPNAYGRIRVLPILQQYLKDWPNLSIEMVFTKRMVDMHEEGFDLSIRIGDVLPDSRLIVKTVGRERAKLYASVDYLAARGTPESIADLKQHDLIFFGDRSGTDVWSLRSLAGDFVTLNEQTRYRADNGEAVLDGAIAGLGIAYLPAFLAKSGLDSGILVPILSDWMSDEIPIYALYPSARYMPVKVKMLVDRIAEELSYSGV